MQILEGYGLSETSPVASFNMPDMVTKPGTIGRAIPGCEMKLVGDDGQDVGPGEGVGEIAIRGDNIMKGYWNKPEATEEAIPDGWFRSGDIASVDEDGFYTIVDRKKDVIIRGGMNVYPREIEEKLLKHPGVGECAVLGLPDPKWGEVGVAVCVPAPGQRPEEAELRAFLEPLMARYKVPKRFVFWDEMPKSGYGKIVKRTIRETLLEQGEQE